jgi:ADP-ribosyl-[dinitrogen reductase] hydrolase
MSMIGACIGDAAGAYLEHMGRVPCAEEVEKALTLPGGGRVRVGPGQVTDDGELTMVLWSALQGKKPIDGPPIYEILCGYAKWFESEPFDMGMTCSGAFELAQELIQGKGDIDSYLSEVTSLNSDSEANGALMRCTPLAAWAASEAAVPASMVALMGRVDAQLSHPSLVCQECNSLYLYAATLLLRGEGPLDVYKKTGEFAMATVSSQKVLKWFFSDSQDIASLKCMDNIGHVRWGFCLAFYFLQNPEITFEEALRQTLLKGGDTDTNAAIVGGLVGCYQSVPHAWKEAILAFRADGSMRGHVRPSWVWPQTYLQEDS